jgi:hypothetical protein
VKRHDDASARLGLLAFLVVGLAAAWLLPLPQVHTSPDGVVMPDLIAGFSRSQRSAETSPPGPTLLTFQSGQLYASAASSSQQVLLGADGITYRKLDEVNVHERDVFLAPDGRSVLLTERNEYTPSIVHVDLVTGARHEFPLTAPQSVVIHAWSPDGRYVAFDESAWNGQGAPGARAEPIRTASTFVLLDLVTSTQTALPQVGPIAAAAFSPDSTRLAVQSGGHAFVIDLHGTVLNDLTIPVEGLVIVRHAAWSPDERWIAMEDSSYWPQIAAVDATGGSAVRGPFHVYGTDVLGWRDPDHLLTARQSTGTANQEIDEISLVDGSAARVAAFATSWSCDTFLFSCETGAPMAAINLLLHVRVLTLPHDNTTLRWEITGAIVLIGACWLWLSVRRRGGAESRQAVPR